MLLFKRGLVYANDIGGQALVKGITARQGVPISCPVRVYQRETGLLLSRTTSNPDGTFTLLGSRKGNYVIAIDPLNELNIARHDRV